MLAWVLYRVAGSFLFPAVIAVSAYTIMYLENQWGALENYYPFETRLALPFMTLLIFGGAMAIKDAFTPLGGADSDPS
jgi:hypothetical protein